MRYKRVGRLIAVGATCAVAGASFGIGVSSAHSGQGGQGKFAGFRGPVHSESVVLNKARTAFVTVTTDGGTLKAVAGNQLTITEGTDKVVYKDATVTVPDGAKVFRNRAPAALTDLKAGDRVRVVSSPEFAFVVAKDPQTVSQKHGRGGHHKGGFKR